MKSLPGWPRDLRVIWDLNGFIKEGGPTPEQRADLAREFSVSEDLLLRYERAAIPYFPIYDKQHRQARTEAALWIKKAGKDILTDNAEFWEKAGEAYERIYAEAPKDEIILEYEAALAGLRVAVNTSPKAPEK